MIVSKDIWENQILPSVEKPAQYCGGELNSAVKDWEEARIKMCFAFPDLYEIGMSHLGLRLIYNAVNSVDGFLCERSFMPAEDMAKRLREMEMPLFAWESRHSLADFDILGFTLQYELSYTNILAMLEMADIPVLAADRSEEHPLVIAGGPCAFNPEPLADFLDMVVLGEGEEVICQLLELVGKEKEQGIGRRELLKKAAAIPGIYVPSLYKAAYKDDNRFAGLNPIDDAPPVIKKRIMGDLDKAPFPDKPILPWVKPVHDRIMLELMRGCTHGCRFCQAGMIYRPLRERDGSLLEKQAAGQLAAGGCDEMALLSLSSADYSDIIALMENLLEAHGSCGVGLSLPSSRVDAMSVSLAARTQEVRKSGMTLAPEAGSQHLRDIINKGVTEEDILSAAVAAFSQGYTSIKLYFMIGLPYEENADITAIGELCRKILQLAKKHRPAEVKKPIKISLGVSSFVPKSHTPFQWQGQDSPEKLLAKQQLLREAIRPMKQVSVRFHDVPCSVLEAVFARGDRRLGRVLLEARKRGCHMDGWSEYFNNAAWQEAFAACGITAAEYAEKQMAFGEPLPWEHLDCGVAFDWMWQEFIRAGRAQLTEDCRNGQCSGCGVCDEDKKCVYAVRRQHKRVSGKKTTLPTEQLYKYRCRLAVEESAAWLSHLDLLCAVERALRRSGLPVAYSQGFNPHMQISWGPAHPVGLFSDSEYLDIIVAQEPQEEWHKRLANALPPGLVLVEAAAVPISEPALMAAVVQADYMLEFVAADEAALDRAINNFMAEMSCFVERKSSKGIKKVDIRPAVIDMHREENKIYYTLRLDKGAAPKPGELSLLLTGGQGKAYRTAMYVQDGDSCRRPL